MHGFRFIFVSAAVLALAACDDDTETTTVSGPSTSTAVGAGGSGGSAGGSAGAGGAGGTVTFESYIGTTQTNLLFVAAQDGDGPWQKLTGEAGLYTFTTSGRFGLAYVCEEPNAAPFTQVIQATTDDFTSVKRTCPGAPPAPTTMLSGTIAGLSSTQTAAILIGPVNANGNGSSYQISLPAGTWNGIIARTDGTTADRLIVLRDFVVAGAAMTRNFDFQSEGSDTLIRNVTINNMQMGDTLILNSFLQLDPSPSHLLDAPGNTIAVAPPSLLMCNDTHLINAFITGPNGLRSVSTYAKAPQDMQFTILDPFTASCSVASQSPITLQCGFDPTTRGDSYGMAIGQGGVLPRVFVALSAGWTGSAAGFTYTTPDLTGLEGWNTNWEFQTGLLTSWFVSVGESTLPIDFDLPASKPEGVVNRTALAGGDVTP